MKLARKLNAIFDRVIGAMVVLAGILLGLMFLSINLEVVFRYFLGKPLGWVVEISEFILVYITFLVAAWVLKGEGHITVDIVLNALNPRSRSLINAITSAINVILWFVLTWYGARVTLYFFQTGLYTRGFLEAPKWPVIFIIFFGSLTLLIQFLRRTYSYLERWRAGQDKRQEAEKIIKSEV